MWSPEDVVCTLSVRECTGKMVCLTEINLVVLRSVSNSVAIFDSSILLIESLRACGLVS
jgi:hypothetical protein